MKNSEIRKEAALYLREWRKSYSVSKVAAHFGHGASKASYILRRSKRYRQSSKRKSRIERYLIQKWHPVRNEVATYLREWKRGLTAEEIASKYKTHKGRVLRYLKCSNKYKSSIRKKPSAEQIKIKKSPFRNKVSRYLITWRNNNYNNALSEKELGISRGKFQSVISNSEHYTKLSNNTNGLSNNETRLLLRYAKKLKIVRSLGGECKKCGNNNIIVLEFHHPKRDKETIVSKLMDGDFNRAKAEAKKCILLCSNCHREEHSQKELINKLWDRIIYKSIRI